MEAVADADSLTDAIKVAISELGDEKGHAPMGDVVDAVRSNRPATAEDVHSVLESLQTRGELYPIGSKIAVTESDAVVTDGGHDVTEDELRNRAAQARAARAEAVLGQGDLAMAERCHKAAVSYRQQADEMSRQVLIADGGEAVVQEENEETPDIMDAVDSVLEELSTTDDPWTTRDGVRAKVRERGFERDMSKRVADSLEENDSAVSWFGYVVRREESVLEAAIEQESEKDVPRTILIGKLNAARRELTEGEAA